jgi:hypothetical protein
MAIALTTETTIPIQHVKVTFDKTFESVRVAFEAIVPKLDPEILPLFGRGEVEIAQQKLESAPEISIFEHRDHGSVLQVAGLSRKVIQYDIGNPLTASKMTRHQLPAGQYAPFRVVLYENEQGHAVFEYDKPSSLFGQFGDERVTAVARGLDAAIETALAKLDYTAV